MCTSALRRQALPSLQGRARKMALPWGNWPWPNLALPPPIEHYAALITAGRAYMAEVGQVGPVGPPARPAEP